MSRRPCLLFSVLFCFVLFCFSNCIINMKFFWNSRIQEQLRRIKRNQEKEKMQPVKKKKEKPPNNVSRMEKKQKTERENKTQNFITWTIEFSFEIILKSLKMKLF